MLSLHHAFQSQTQVLRHQYDAADDLAGFEIAQCRASLWELATRHLDRFERPYTRPHPFIIRSSGSEESMVEIARNRRPFMMNVQSFDVTKRRMDLYRQTLRAQGLTEAEVQGLVANCWVWRNVVVAETDAEAERVGVPLFQEMQQHRAAMRERVFKEQGVRLQSHAPGPTAPAARTVVEHALIHGSPATVAEKLAAIDAIGVGGLIISFRLGPMAHDLATSSLRLFAEKVMPVPP